MNRDDDLVVPGMLTHHEVTRALDAYRADLHAKVKGLTTRGIGARVIDGELETYALVERDEVLALLDGGSDSAAPLEGSEEGWVRRGPFRPTHGGSDDT